MKIAKDNLEKSKNEFSRNLFISISFIFLFYFFISLHYHDKHEFYYNKSEYFLAIFIFCSYLGFIISKLEYNFITFYRTILLFLTILVCNNVLLICHLTLLAYCFFIPLIFFASFLYNKKITLLIGIFFLVFSISAKTISLNLNISHPIKIPIEIRDFDLYNRISVVVMSVYFSIFIIYYKNKFKKIQSNNENFFSDNNNNFNTINFIQDQNKFEKLCVDIQNIIVENKLFQDADFSKKKLAEMLNTNETYISKALSLQEHKNFKSILNQYRIEQVIEDFKNKKHKTFTIEHIYLKAGFKQQSTFNRVFKEIIGITPTEYIEAIDKKTQD